MYNDCLLSPQALVHDSSLIVHRLGDLLVLLLLVVIVVLLFVLIVEEEKDDVLLLMSPSFIHHENEVRVLSFLSFGNTDRLHGQGCTNIYIEKKEQ